LGWHVRDSVGRIRTYYTLSYDGGATFLNNYIAGTMDYVSRIAGMLLIDGKMENVRQVATLVPVYLVNAPEAVVAKYKKADSTDASIIEGGGLIRIKPYSLAEILNRAVVVALNFVRIAAIDEDG